jgi:hypothetical protein
MAGWPSTETRTSLPTNTCAFASNEARDERVRALAYTSTPIDSAVAARSASAMRCPAASLLAVR